jgi:hypothetical protein
MPRLRIDLQEGFNNDTVAVRVDGAEVFRKTGVKTRPPVGVAESFEVEASDPAHVEIEVATKQQSAAVDLHVSEFPYLGVSSSGGGLELNPSRELFRYM